MTLRAADALPDRMLPAFQFRIHVGIRGGTGVVQVGLDRGPESRERITRLADAFADCLPVCVNLGSELVQLLLDARLGLGEAGP